ncbi:hypothetical protein CCO02nite_30170 [Cellulomonas composti]|uniref:Uncharacterized protein n=1 Tax=Cellulomonas composti TaxID=266130 RepID=A0A511JEY5_9CELL|nr:hypothetical protein CCO02nite_30170 [Cellulomonas composti]
MKDPDRVNGKPRPGPTDGHDRQEPGAGLTRIARVGHGRQYVSQLDEGVALHHEPRRATKGPYRTISDA